MITHYQHCDCNARPATAGGLADGHQYSQAIHLVDCPECREVISKHVASWHPPIEFTNVWPEPARCDCCELIDEPFFYMKNRDDEITLAVCGDCARLVFRFAVIKAREYFESLEE